MDLHGELDTLQRVLTDAHADPLSVVPPPVLAAALAAELSPRCMPATVTNRLERSSDACITLMTTAPEHQIAWHVLVNSVSCVQV